ncbi:MAG: hypothetical protein KKA67_00605 [Spirochaetes bacterium]|nr:hypothetical protein [Spirochaetota bacterium]MBU1080591.1 hypothetical protein [Spirochaetota bacterium]
MLKFFLKKSFYDGWDNMLALACFNAAALALVGLGIWLPSLVDSAAARLAGLAFTVAAVSVWWSITAHAFWKAADGKTVRLGDVRPAIAAGVVPGLQFGAMAAASIVAASIAFPFYASIGGFVGLFATSVAFWLFLALWLTLQYFLPVSAADGKGFRSALKSSLILFIDAPLFSLALALDCAVCVAVSPLVAFLLPGPAAAALASCEAVRLRRYRLSWLAGSDGKPGPTPWAGLLADDVEALGSRGLKDLFFPWKH